MKRQEFAAYLKTKNPEKLVYIDETGLDNRSDYGYGWNEKGKRFYALKLGKRSIRVSIIAALNQKQLIAPMTFEGSCNLQVNECVVRRNVNPSFITRTDNYSG